MHEGPAETPALMVGVDGEALEESGAARPAGDGERRAGGHTDAVRRRGGARVDQTSHVDAPVLAERGLVDAGQGRKIALDRDGVDVDVVGDPPG